MQQFKVRCASGRRVGVSLVLAVGAISIIVLPMRSLGAKKSQPSSTSSTASSNTRAAVPASLALASGSPIGNPNAVQGGTFTVNLGTEPAILHPISGFDIYAREVQAFVLDPLLDRNPDTYEWMPALAERVEVSPDAKTYTFTLRKGAAFHDGVPVTAEDVKFSFDAIFDPKYDAAHQRPYYENIEKAEVLDERTVRFTVKGKYFGNLDMIAKLMVVPKHFYGGTEADKKKNKTCLGSGPYKLEKYEQGQSLVLVRNHAWWGDSVPELRGRFNFERIRLRFDGDENVAIEKLKKGEIDYDGLTPEAFMKKAVGAEWGDDKAVTTKKVENKAPKGYGFIGWNLRRELFQDREVRLALYHLLNREEMNKKFRYGLSALATGPWYQASEYASPKVKPVTFDPKQAAALLKKAGWVDSDKDGVLDKVMGGVKRDFRFTLVFGHADQEKYWVLYQSDLKKVGVQMDLQRLEWNNLMKVLKEGNFDATALAWGGGVVDLDPKNVWHSASIAEGSNFIGYRNPEVDRLIDEARTELDKKKRIGLYRRIYELVAADVPYAFLFNDRYTLYAHSTRVRMPKPSYNYRVGTEYWWADLK